MTNILIVDDHPLVREGVKKVLAGEPDISIVAEAKDASEITRYIDTNEVDLVLLDISMPGKDGLEALKEVKLRFPTLPVLILSMHPEERFAMRALEAGASGYVTKMNTTEELVKAIRTVRSGKNYMSSILADKLVSQLQSKSPPPTSNVLSDREFQILRLIASGKTAGEIARQLYLSVNTVNTHRRRILEKMSMKTTVELIQYAIQNQIVE
jgi:DNA-binding NarL/FixJ family response regulator